jgi:hypothetical protein
MDDFLQISIEASNKNIEILADMLRETFKSKSDNGLKGQVIITYSVDPKTGSINQKRDFKAS